MSSVILHVSHTIPQEVFSDICARLKKLHLPPGFMLTVEPTRKYPWTHLSMTASGDIPGNVLPMITSITEPLIHKWREKETSEVPA